MPIETVLFDMDGTILSTMEDLYDTINYSLEHFGFRRRTAEEVRQFVGSGADELVRRALADQNATPEQVAEVAHFFRGWYESHNCNKTRPYPGIPELLEQLKRAGIKAAVVSNKPDVITRALAELFFPGLPAYGQVSDLPAKPAPDLVYRALREMDMPRESAVYVGDSEVDVQTAQNAGMPLCAVCWGFRTREELVAAGAECISADAGELAKNLGL